MNGLDVAIVALAVIGLGYGMLRGVLRMATSIVSLCAAIYLASIYYPRAAAVAAHQLGMQPGLAAVLGYAVVFGAVFIAVELAGNLVSRLVRSVHLGWFDRLCGALLGLGIAAMLAGFMLMLLTTVLPLDTPLLARSELAPHVLGFTDALLDFVPNEFKQAYYDKRDQLTRYWLERALASHHAEPSAVPTH